MVPDRVGNSASSRGPRGVSTRASSKRPSWSGASTSRSGTVRAATAKLRKTDKLQSAPDVVSIWMNAALDPQGTLDGRGGPVGWFDHDCTEATRGNFADVIRLFSRSDGFADAAVKAHKELGAPVAGRVDLIYGVKVDTPPGRRAYGWFIGSFTVERTA
jgi:hypothetical protein